MAYSISRWDELFENAMSRRFDRVKWFACPIKKGKGYHVLAQRSGARFFEVYGIFISLCALAAQTPYRGILSDASGPYTLDIIAALIGNGCATAQIESAVDLLSDPHVGWLRYEPLEVLMNEWTFLNESTRNYSKKPDGTTEIENKHSLELANLLIAGMKTKPVTTVRASAFYIARLLKRVSKEEVTATIAWLNGPNQERGKYAFVVASGRALLEKWDSIQATMKRPTHAKDPRDKDYGNLMED